MLSRKKILIILSSAVILGLIGAVFLVSQMFVSDLANKNQQQTIVEPDISSAQLPAENVSTQSVESEVKVEEPVPTKTLLTKIKEAIIPPVDPKKTPSEFQLDVPFAAQAPFGEWEDQRQQDGCEEASLIMAWHWLNNKSLSKDEAKKEILAISDFEEKLIGTFIDTSAEDTVKIFKEYYKNNNIKTVYDITAESIKKELLAGKVVLVPTDGTILKNPYYTAPGPIRHMVVIKGFDDDKKVFITNDPGTRRGESFKYSYDVVMKAIINYSTGNHADLIDDRKVMIVVSK